MPLSGVTEDRALVLPARRASAYSRQESSSADTLEAPNNKTNNKQVYLSYKISQKHIRQYKLSIL